MTRPGGPSRTALCVGLVLAEYANGDGESCYPSQDTLADATGYTSRAVREALRVLEVDGWVQVESEAFRGGDRGQGWRRNAYRLCLPEGGEASSAPCPEGRERRSARSAKVGNEVPVKVGNDVPTTKNNTTKNTYTPQFEEAWSVYPKRSGSNPKRAAFKAWNARLKDGGSPPDLLAGTRRYAAWCDAEGQTGTRFVMQARTFFGPEEHWRETWEIKPSGTGATSSSYDAHDELAAMYGEAEP